MIDDLKYILTYLPAIAGVSMANIGHKIQIDQSFLYALRKGYIGKDETMQKVFAAIKENYQDELKKIQLLYNYDNAGDKE